MSFKQILSGNMLRVVPKKTLSHYVGSLVHTKLPGPISNLSVSAFQKYYNINMDEAEHPIEHYRTIGELFTRKLKPGVRPVGAEPVHPADGKLTAYGVVENDQLLQAKKRHYLLDDFLGSEEMAFEFEGGKYFTYYLCPTDYHRVHSPVSGGISRATLIPGQLWPVNEWSVETIPDLFAQNERIVVEIITSWGPVAVVLVGATNVGKMTVSFDEQIVSNKGQTEIFHRDYQEKIKINAGDELGTFHMGSTVVVLYSKSFEINYSKEWGAETKVNASLNESAINEGVPL